MNKPIKAGKILEFIPYLPQGDEAGVVKLVLNDWVASKPCLICVHEILNPEELGWQPRRKEETNGMAT